MIKQVFSLSSLSLVGYAIGFINQVIIAQKFGVSHELDIYLMAVSFVTFGWFFAGPLTESSIPILHKAYKKNIKYTSFLFSRFLNNYILLSIIMMAIIILLILLILTITNDNILIIYTAFLVPIILLSSLSFYFTGVLNSISKYFGQSIVKIISSFITFLILWFFVDSLGIYSLLIATLLSQLIVVSIQIYLIYKSSIIYDFKFFGYARKNYLKMTLLLSITYFLSALFIVYEKWAYTYFGKGMLSSFNYATILYQVPLGIFLTPLLSIFWTELMNKLHKENVFSAIKWLKKVMLQVGIITILISVIFYTNSYTLIKLIFERGSFTSTSTMQVSIIFSAFLLGLPQYVIIQFLIRLLTSMHRKKELFYLGISFVIIPSIFISSGIFFENIDLIIYSLPINYTFNLIFGMYLIKKMEKDYE